MKYILMFIAVLVLSACGDDDKPTKKEMSAEQRADNPLLKIQDDTTKKAEDAINTTLKNQQEALDKVGQ